MGLYNKDLKPEQTKSIDAGINIGLFDRITLEASWYNRRTEQALLDVPIPSSTGYTTLKRNIGILENRGFEFGVNMKVLDTNDWLLSLRGNIAYNRTKLLIFIMLIEYIPLKKHCFLIMRWVSRMI